MRTIATFLAAVALSAAVVLSPTAGVAQETIVTEGDAAAVISEGQAGCGCQATQAPPWHASVAGDPCGPCCPPPNLFHANPCGQLCLKHSAHQHGCTLPPCFPRMHARLAEGRWPTPRPICVPRCPRCGALIEGGW